MNGFFGYNQIEILPSYQHKATLIFPWGSFSYKKLPFILKNAHATYQCTMSYAFHGIKDIVEPYLDDLPAHSQQQDHHVDHMRAIFLRCHH